MYREKILTMLPVLNNSETRIVKNVNNAIRYAQPLQRWAQLELLIAVAEELREK